MMEVTLFIVGTISLVFGLGLLFFPRTIIQIGEYMNRVLATDETVMSKRRLWAVLFILAGLAILYRVLFLSAP